MTQAQRIIDKFGGAYPLARAIGYAPATVFKWTYPKGRSGGTGGIIPARAVPRIVAAATRLRIAIPARAWAP